jgi:tRNA dimethylallyltransferase
MMVEGWLEEAARLRQLERPLSREAAQALGYQEVFAFLDGQATLEETIERIQIGSRHFAKRQISWIRHLPECRPVTRDQIYANVGLRFTPAL